eukprot:gene7810-10608_t
MIYLFFFIISLTCFDNIKSICNDGCHSHGLCINNFCECFDGWEGVDCADRSCPLGLQLSSIPFGYEDAHSSATCSGKGICNKVSGECICDVGYSGHNCGKLKCFNDCSGNGECISLRNAASLNDGYQFNRSTSYSLWDADIIHGCRCDPGWSGADCSERVCEFGFDPRLEQDQTTKFNLVCSCVDDDCNGKFKLRFMDFVLPGWFKPTTRAQQVADAIMQHPFIASKIPVYTSTPVTALSNGSSTNPVCSNGYDTTTIIYFHRNVGLLPTMSFYANLITGGGTLYFETKQILHCDCISNACNGTLRLSFDGEMSDRLYTWKNGTDVEYALKSMKTIQLANINIKLTNLQSAPLCLPGYLMNHTILLHAPFGNVPSLGLWSSVTNQKSPKYYSTTNSTRSIYITTNDGSNRYVKLCNGIGECDFTSGTCKCPYGWGFDPDIGPCGKLIVNTSSWGGLARCPGLTSFTKDAFSGKYVNELNRMNYNTRIYLSFNPMSNGSVANATDYNNSFISYFDWNPEELKIDYKPGKIVLNLTSSSSAGPLVIDQALDHLIFVDQNPNNRFIGIAPMRKPGNYS